MKKEQNLTKIWGVVAGRSLHFSEARNTAVVHFREAPFLANAAADSSSHLLCRSFRKTTF